MGNLKKNRIRQLKQNGKKGMEVREQEIEHLVSFSQKANSLIYLMTFYKVHTFSLSRA